jgi:hypothetical protein
MILPKRYRLFGIVRLCEGRISDLPIKNGMLVFGVGGSFLKMSAMISLLSFVKCLFSMTY